MKKDFVLYKEALALKKLGFDEPCFGAFNSSNKLKLATDLSCSESQEMCKRVFDGVSAPTYQQIFRWFREKHNLHIELIWDVYNSKLIWYTAITEIADTEHKSIVLKRYNTAEEAQLVGLRKLISIVKNNEKFEKLY